MNTQDNEDRSAWWFDGFASAGCWESINHRLRMGVAPTDWKIKAEQELDENWIAFLASRGVNRLMTYYSKGFGPENEAPVRENARKLKDLGHKHGMKIACYLSDTVMLETFSLEEPDVINWLQVNHNGNPVHYGGDQTHRRKGCFNNPGWRAYMKRMLKMVHDDGFDGAQPDNNIWWPEPDGCRCDVCRAGFRQFVKERFPTPEQCMDRFGLTSLDAVEPPLYSEWFKPWDMDAIRNPLIQEWVHFRSESIASFRKELWDFVHESCPGMVLLLPSSGITARNMAWMHGEDHNRTTGLHPTVCTEEPVPCVYDPERDALGSKIRSMRLARRCGAIMFHNAYIAHERDAKPEAMLAEGLAFNQGSIGGVAAFHWASKSWPDYTDRYVRFASEHKPLLTHVDGMADTAVLHSTASFAFDGLRTRMCALLMEQAMIQNNVLFDIILDRHLADLDRYRILVLPGSTCMSDEQAGLVTEWVKKGGALLATDRASSKDQWRRDRPFAALSEVFGWPMSDRMMQQSGEGEYMELAEEFKANHTFRRFGKGMAIYIPETDFRSGPPEQDNTYYKTHHWHDWQLPENTEEIMTALRTLGYDRLFTTFPRWVVCELTRLTSMPGIALHMLNYRKNSPVGEARVSLKLPGEWKSPNVSLLSPDWDKARDCDYTMQDGRLNIFTPEFEDYCIAHISEK